MVRASFPVLLLALAAGCGRSDLNDQLDEVLGLDGGFTGDDSSGDATSDGSSTDDSTMPPEDVIVLPPPPPPEDAPPPPPPPPPACGPRNCAGCCQGPSCLTGDVAFACGQNGAQCEACNAQTGGFSCFANPSGVGGHCGRPSTAPCDGNSCPTGCCINGICAQGSQDIACGSGGGSCVDCTASGLSCAGQQCSFP
jgi:hypothetical protein